MRRKTLLLTFLFFYFVGYSQQSFNFSCQKDTVINGCESSCITLQAKIPDIFGSSATNYSIVRGNFSAGGCFQIPPVQPNGAGTSANLTLDDRYSTAVNIGFPFSFFGTSYSQLVASTNGLLSFDVSLATDFSHYSILNNLGTLSATTGTPQDLPSALYDRALIMGPYHDIDPAYTTSPTQKIQYTTVGTAPYRKWVLSFYKVPLFDCQASIENTHQIILNESTGIIQILIYNKQICTSWNDGRAMIGIQDFSRTQSFMVPGRRASDAPWTVTSNNNNTAPMESYSFIPAGGNGSTSLLKRVELYNMAGTLISTGTSVSNNDGTRVASFPNICPPIGTTSYVVRSVYQKNDNAAVEVFGTDTVRIIKNSSNLVATTAVQAATCLNSAGTINVNVNSGSGVAPFQYSINGNAYQANNAFTGLAPGAYTFIVKDANSCIYSVTTSVPLNNTLSVSAFPSDTSICTGSTFVPRVNSNISTASYSWTPSFGVSAPIPGQPYIPTITASSQNTKYILTATQGLCQSKDTINVTVFTGAQANAGSDALIIAGDVIQLNGSGTAGTYLWTPSAGLSATNILRPMASPSQTTTYTLQVTSPQGCVATDQVQVNVVPYCVKPMEAFTPNGDGINDVWLITNGSCLKTAKAEVFNRYGHKVFEDNDYHNNWNGTYKGSPLPDGTYYFVITYQLINQKAVYLKGNVTILR